jgi:hypothetical protein
MSRTWSSRLTVWPSDDNVSKAWKVRSGNLGVSNEFVSTNAEDLMLPSEMECFQLSQVFLPSIESMTQPRSKLGLY